MADGATKPIADVKIGDKVANAEPDDRDVQHLVTALRITDNDRDFAAVTVAIPAGPKTIVSTAHHLFWDATTRTYTEYVLAGATPILVHNCGGPVRLSDDTIDTHILPLHRPGSPATGTKFSENIDPDDYGALVNEAISGSPIPSEVDSVTGNHAHDFDFGPGRETGVRVWVDPDGNVATMYPR